MTVGVVFISWKTCKMLPSPAGQIGVFGGSIVAPGAYV